MKKHVWAILLAMLLVIGLMPAALAEETQQTGLMFREAYWNEYDELELNPTLHSGWEAAPGDETLVKFFYVTEENPDGVEVALEELNFSGISAEYYEGTDFIYIMVEEFGECTVSYEADDQTHTLIISSVLPPFGFYSEPVISEENYLYRITLTEVGQSVYFIVGEGATVSTINIGGFGAFADLTQISETCWQITITGRPWFRDGNYGLPITGTYNGEEVSGGAMLRILDQMPGLVFRYAFHDGENFVEDENDYFHGIMEEAVTAEPVIRFYFYDGEENYEPIPVGEVNGTESVRVDTENDDLVRLSFTALGEHYVSYERDGEEYSLLVNLLMPDFGFYTEPFVSEETLIRREFEVTAENNTIYFIVNNDPNDENYNYGQIFDLELMGHFGEIAEARPFTDPEAGPVTCWEITIDGRARNGEWYDVRFNGVTPWGEYFEEYWEGLHLFDNSPALVLRYVDHDGQNFVENENPFEYQLHLAIGHRPVVRFYFFDGENYSPVDPGELIFSEDIFGHDAPAYEIMDGFDAYGNPVQFIQPIPGAWGWGSIGYEFEGTVYELPVYVRLPEIGFYYEPLANEENWISEFTVSGAGAVCYVMAINGTTLTDVRLLDEFNDVAVIEQLDETCWKITFTGEPMNDHWYRIACDGFHGDGWEFYDCEESIFVRNTMPRLLYRDLYWIDDGVWGEDENWDLHDAWYGPINCSTFVRIYFFNGTETVPVDPADLRWDGSVSVNFIEGTDFVEFWLHAWENATIDYEYEGTVYSLPIYNELPNFGFYSTPEASRETYLTDIRVTESDSLLSFYFIAASGATLTHVEPIYGFEEIAQAEYINETCWKITINGEFEDGRYYSIYYTGTGPWGDYIEYAEEGIQFFDVAPRLVLRQLWETEEGPIEHPEWEWGLHHTEWRSSIDYHAPVKFYFFDGENYIAVDFEDLRWDGCINLYIYEDDGILRIEPTGCGGGTIYYEHTDGNTYEFPVEIVLPTSTFYTSPEASEESYLGREFVLSGDYAELYYIAIDGATLTHVEPIYGFENFAQAERLNDTCWKITISGEVEYDRWCHIRYSGTEPLGEEFEPREDSFWLTQDPNTPHLAFRDLPMDEDGNWYEDESWGLNRGWYGPIGSHVNVRVYFFDGENYFPVDPDDLISTDAITINRISDTDYTEFITNAWGEHAISYEYDGTVYSLPITVDLPDFGFYSSTEPSHESYLTELRASDENRVFYFLAAHGASLSRVTLHENFDDFADIERISDTCYRITLTGAFESYCGFGLTFDGNESNGNPLENWEQYITLVDIEPRLVLRQLWETEEGPIEHPEWDWGLNHDEWTSSIGYHAPVKLYFFDGENYSAVDFEALRWDGCINLYIGEGENFIRIEPTGWGSGTIYYDHGDGNTYAFPVHIVLPTFGFYTTPYPSEDSYIWELRMIGEGAEIYFIAIDGATLYHVEPIYGFEEIAYAEPIDDTCWKITISGEFEDGRYYNILYSGNEPWNGENGDFEREDGLHIWLDENAPRLLLRDLAMDENGNWYEEESWGLYRDWYGPIGNRFYVRVYFFDGENYYPVDPDDLYSDGAVAINRVDDTDYVEFTTNAWGDHTVYYEYGGETYSLKLHVQLADFGFYSSEEASEETYLTEFHFSDENRVFYFVAAHGATLSRVTLNGDHDAIADIEYISDTCYRITITDAFENGYWLDVSFDGTESNGNPVENWGQGICLVNWDPDAEILAQAEAMGLLQYLEVYDLNATLSRLDAAKLMAAMLDIAPIPDAELPFTDCDDLTQEEKDIVAAIVDTGIIKGIAEGTFDPYGTLTRAQLATMIYRALGEPETENSVNAPETVWYLKAVLALQDLGIITDENITTNAGEIIQIRDALEWMIRAKAILGSGGIRPGDLNGDDEVNTRDVIVLLDAIAAISTGEWSEDLRAAADVNGDGRISVRDAIIILDSIAARTTNEL